MSTNSFQLLHISDLHITEGTAHDDDGNFDLSLVLYPLISRVELDLMEGIKPEVVIVTGDIAYHGCKAEYTLAKEFFDKLLNIMKLDATSLFLIPGNHDVNRKKYRPSDIPNYVNMRDLNEELANSDFREDLLKGMADYFSFVKVEYSHLESIRNNLVPFVQTHVVGCGKKIALVGLNSAWMCRRSPDKGEIAIGEYQVKSAMEELKQKGDMDLIINCFHHPLEWLWPDDSQTIRAYLPARSVSLCGHLHSAAGGYYQDLDGQYMLFQAGAAYIGSESSWPARYQYITFDWEQDCIQLDFRKYVSNKRKWSVDGETGDDGKKTFIGTGILSSETHRLEQPLTQVLVIPESYKNWIRSKCGHMDVEKLQAKGQAIRVSLPEVFIPLYGYDPVKEKHQEQKSATQEAIEQHVTRVQNEAVDIEKLISKYQYLLLQGQAGSGKTTILRHLAYRLVSGTAESHMQGCIPVLIFLKDIESHLQAHEKDKRRKLMAWDILDLHLGQDEEWISASLLKQFGKKGKLIILLDGLDEISPSSREIIIEAFNHLRCVNEKIKIVLSGRPHGIAGTAMNHFGEHLVEVLPLVKNQVELFINRWFHEVSADCLGLEGKTAQQMMAEIQAHDSIRDLTDTPLMLTAICILYHDGRELPNQRAELYHKFIDNMLHRRFSGRGQIMEPEQVKEFLMTLAFDMHQKRVRGIDKVSAITILNSILRKMDEKGDKELRKRAELLFDEIEPRCGLLKFENDGQYLFWHHTFQEFLTALYLQDNSIDYIDAIQPYLDDDWYREVIKLYIGSLSMANKRTANTIIENIVDGAQTAPAARGLLAAGSLLDVHIDRRNPQVEKKTRRCLLAIIEREDSSPDTLAEAGETLGWLGDTRDLMEFVIIEGGVYDTTDSECTPKADDISIESFEIGRFPVTNGWYREFVESGGYHKQQYWSPEGLKFLKASSVSMPRLWEEKKWTCPNSPVVGVSWYEADAFTKWLSEKSKIYIYQLPTEIEWEATAAGFYGKREFPWGDEWCDRCCNSEESRLVKTSPVGLFHKGNTPEGISDLAGNVWEWTNSDYHSFEKRSDFEFDPEMIELLEKCRRKEDYKSYFAKLSEQHRQLPVLRGGSWNDDRSAARCAARLWDFPNDGSSLWVFVAPGP